MFGIFLCRVTAKLTEYTALFIFSTEISFSLDDVFCVVQKKIRRTNCFQQLPLK